MAKKSTMSISASNSSSFCCCVVGGGSTAADAMAEEAEAEDIVVIFLVELKLIGIFELEAINNVLLLPLATVRSCFDAEGAAGRVEEEKGKFIDASPFVVVVTTGTVISAEEDDVGPIDC